MALRVGLSDICTPRMIRRCFAVTTVVSLTLVILLSCTLKRFGLVLSWQTEGDLVIAWTTHLECNVDLHNATSLLGATRQDDLNKIRSYTFPGTYQSYIDDLFPPIGKHPVPTSDVPVFVSALSSNRLVEGYLMLKNFTDTVVRTNRGVKLILFDIGLTNAEFEEVNTTCSFCDLRRFPFNKYPVHVRHLMNYAWKSLIIQTVAREYPFLIWMDTSVRFRTGQLTKLFAQIKQQGLLMYDMGTPRLTGTITERTHQSTFRYLHENPCAFTTQAEKADTFVLLYADDFIVEYFLKPLVSCALAYGCMEPGGLSPLMLDCGGAPQSGFTFQWCHRFDQSVMGILFTRLFHGDLKRHTVDTAYFNICRGRTGTSCDF